MRFGQQGHSDTPTASCTRVVTVNNWSPLVFPDENIFDALGTVSNFAPVVGDSLPFRARIWCSFVDFFPNKYPRLLFQRLSSFEGLGLGSLE